MEVEWMKKNNKHTNNNNKKLYSIRPSWFIGSLCGACSIDTVVVATCQLIWHSGGCSDQNKFVYEFQCIIPKFIENKHLVCAKDFCTPHFCYLQNILDPINPSHGKIILNISRNETHQSQQSSSIVDVGGGELPMLSIFFCMLECRK